MGEVNAITRHVTQASLLADHADETKKFHALVRAFQKDLDRLDFPLGSPAHGYDLKDIRGYLSDWLEPAGQLTLEWNARTILNDREVAGER